jgi:hypothetical protein
MNTIIVLFTNRWFYFRKFQTNYLDSIPVQRFSEFMNTKSTPMTRDQNQMGFFVKIRIEDLFLVVLQYFLKNKTIINLITKGKESMYLLCVNDNYKVSKIEVIKSTLSIKVLFLLVPKKYIRSRNPRRKHTEFFKHIDILG